jgi:hypothetical protein
MTAPVPPTTPDVSAQIQAKIDEIFGSSNYRGRVEQVVKESYKYRRRAKAAEDELAALKLKLPKEGEQVVLSKTDADELTAFRALGKVADLTVMKTEHATLSTKKAEADEAQRFADAGEALGYKNIPALTRFMIREQLHLEMQDSRREDPDDPSKKITVRLPFVRPKADEKAKLVPLDEYIEEQVPEFIDAFASEPESDEEQELDEEQEEPAARRRSVRQQPGVTIAATPGARRGAAAPATRDKKVLEEMEKTARGSGMYSA